MTLETAGSGDSLSLGPGLSPGQLAQVACLLEVTARKPGNVHRYADLPGLHFVDFLLSAMAIAEPLDQAAPTGVGRAVLAAIEATRRVVSTNTNLGIVLLLAPLAAVSEIASISPRGSRMSWRRPRSTTRGTFIARSGWPNPAAWARCPTRISHANRRSRLRAVMAMAAERDLIARQYANGFREVLGEALPALRESLDAGWPLETAIVSSYLTATGATPGLIDRAQVWARPGE